MTATAIFPDRMEYELDESAARHMQVGDTVLVREADVAGRKSHRAGVVTRRSWLATELTVICTDWPAPTFTPTHAEERDS